MPFVYVSGYLEKYINIQGKINIKGDTVQRAIENISQLYPELELKLFRNGTISRQIIILVDGTDIRKLDNEKTEIGKDTIIRLMPSLVGG